MMDYQTDAELECRYLEDGDGEDKIVELIILLIRRNHVPTLNEINKRMLAL